MNRSSVLTETVPARAIFSSAFIICLQFSVLFLEDESEYQMNNYLGDRTQKYIDGSKMKGGYPSSNELQIAARTLIFIFLLIFVPARFSFGTSKTPVADALDWYATWLGQSMTTPGIQTCQGEFLDNRYEFRCDPLGVVVNAQFHVEGRCFVSGMRPGISFDDGTRLQPLPRGRRPSHPDCPELPIDKRYFKVQVTPHPRQLDQTL